MTGPPSGGQTPELVCPRCGAPHREEQEYCLECGLRLGEAGGRVRPLEAAWRSRRGSYPGDWVWVVLLFLLIAAAGATAAIVLASSGGEKAKPIVATGGERPHVPTTPPATETVALPTVPSGTPTSTSPTPTTPPATTTPPSTPPPPGALVTWPASRNGFTVVLESVPRAAGRSFALARARSAARTGLPKVGVLDSSGFSSLHAGYYVVFSGIYSTNSEADQARATAASKGYSRAYSREIRR